MQKVIQQVTYHLHSADEFLPGVKNRGTYNNATAYALNDLVTYGASVYRATIANGNLPTDTSHWTLYVNV